MARPKGARDAAYQQKRQLLLQRIASRLGQLNDTHPSLRQLAVAAEVTVPTLRHYFGGRDEIVEQVMAEFRQMGAPFLEAARQPHGPFAESIREFLQTMAMGMRRGRLGDIFSIGLIEGTLNERLGPAGLTQLVDPAVDALTARLQAHQAAGEMKPGNARHAALMLLAPVLVGWHHQHQMFGRTTRPLDLDAFLEDLAAAFIVAHAVGPQTPGGASA